MIMKYSKAALLIAVFSMAACSSGPALQMQDYPEPVFSAERVVPADAEARSASAVYDPWAGMNRRIYNFNYHFDRYLFLPAVRGYQNVTPDFAEEGVSNFFDNLRDVNTFLNSVLHHADSRQNPALARIRSPAPDGLTRCLFDRSQ